MASADLDGASVAFSASSENGIRPIPISQGGHTLRLLSYNIQTGIASNRYRHYLTHSWKHVFPDTDRWVNLDRIAQALTEFDLVGLQEVDSGSLRTGFVNQTEYLARQANFPFWYYQTNRRLGKLAQHSNGLLSRLRPHEFIEHKLPGLPGRGALVARFGARSESLAIVIIHLALGKRGRFRQMAYLSELINQYPNAILMGDLNCGIHSQELRYLLRNTCLRTSPQELNTFPSWRPRRRFDHILATPDIQVRRAYIPDWMFSDHLPVAMEVVVPESVRLRT